MVKVSNIKMTPTTSYKFTVLGENNKHKPYLFNEVREFIKDKGITTTFEIGKNKINMSAESRKIALNIAKGLKKLGIVEGALLK